MRAMKGIQYSKRMVAFLDIVGFERIVDKSRNDAEIVQKLANILISSKQIALAVLRAKPTILQVDPTQYVYRAFSDTSVISGPYTSHDDLIFISTWVMYYQYLLWKEEQSFLRGAIVYGDIYHNEDVTFGPAIIDAYHLENDDGKAVWPRVLIDKSLLDKVTEVELTRDLFEIFRRDNNNLVYCDYLREFFHLMMLGELEKTTGKREEDFGDPMEFLGDHKAAILTQIHSALEEEQDDSKRKGIIAKYFELSRYHNATIDVLCQAIDALLTPPGAVGEIFDDISKSALDEHAVSEYISKYPKYKLEDHPEQADILSILGKVASGILKNHIKDALSLEAVFNALSIEAPRELAKLERSLSKSKIDLDSITVHL
jgi:hypothetical protein